MTALVERTLNESLKLWAPPTRATLTQWAEEFFVLSSEASAETGLFTALAFQREPLDAITDPRVETVVIMSATQMLKTTIILVALGYVIDRDPGPVMVICPRDSDVDKFSKIRLAPMLRDTPCLRGKVAESKSRHSMSTLDYKRFHGGHIAITAAGSPGNLAALPIRYLMCDEIDKYPLSAGSEGDPISLAKKRTITYRRRRKIILTCSPTVANTSRIAKAYALSDQRKYFVPCPVCKTYQTLEWAQVRFNDSLPVAQIPASAFYQCVKCHAPWNDQQRWRAVDLGHWRAGHAFNGSAGFHISELYSPWRTLGEIVADYWEKKDDRQQYRTFVNTTLAELWVEEGETPEWATLHDRRESYPFGYEPAVANEEAVVPMGGLFLTCGVDVQRDRLEYEVTAWGRGKESWSVAYGVIRLFDDQKHPIQTADTRYLDELEKVLATEWRHEGGASMPIMAMAIDTGERPKPVYEFAKRHARLLSGTFGVRVHAERTVIPIKGTSKEALRIVASVTKEDAARRRQNIHIISVGTGVAKQELYDNLRNIPRPADGARMPGYCHFPEYASDYFQGLCNEKRVVHEDGSVTWEKLGRNEPLDCRVYSMAAAYVFGIDRLNEGQWIQLEKNLGLVAPPPPPLTADPTPPANGRPIQPPPPPPAGVPVRRRVSSTWMSRVGGNSFPWR